MKYVTVRKKCSSRKEFFFFLYIFIFRTKNLSRGTGSLNGPVSARGGRVKAYNTMNLSAGRGGWREKGCLVREESLRI
jgi:hypothetical protein